MKPKNRDKSEEEKNELVDFDDLLEKLLSIPSQLSVPLLKIDPTWNPLRDNPRFRKLIGGNI